MCIEFINYFVKFCALLFDRLKGEFILEDGKSVEYEKIKGSKLFQEYVDQLAPQLQYVSLDNISENEKKAFFISILCLFVVTT